MMRPSVVDESIGFYAAIACLFCLAREFAFFLSRRISGLRHGASSSPDQSFPNDREHLAGFAGLNSRLPGHSHFLAERLARLIEQVGRQGDTPFSSLIISLSPQTPGTSGTPGTPGIDPVVIL